MALNDICTEWMLNTLARRLAAKTDYLVMKKSQHDGIIRYAAIQLVPNTVTVPGIIIPTFVHQVVDIIDENWLEWMLQKNLICRAGSDRACSTIYVFNAQGGP